MARHGRKVGQNSGHHLMSKLSLWCHRRETDTDRINALLPMIGEVPFNPDKFCLETYRRYMNGYCDLYQNGACNWKLYGENFRWVAREYKVSGLNVRDMLREIDYKGYCNRLEQLGDMIINAVLKEQFGETEYADQFN